MAVIAVRSAPLPPVATSWEKGNQIVPGRSVAGIVLVISEAFFASEYRTNDKSIGPALLTTPTAKRSRAPPLVRSVPFRPVLACTTFGSPSMPS